MKHRKRFALFAITLAMVVLGTAALGASAAFAESGGGSGTLTAAGDGLAGIRGNGTATISGNGILWVRDQSGDASIQVSGYGYKSELPGGWTRYSGFHGRAEASGSAITVALSGYDIELTARGTGSFVLRGNGTYSVESGGVVVAHGAWTRTAEVKSLP